MNKGNVTQLCKANTVDLLTKSCEKHSNDWLDFCLWKYYHFIKNSSVSSDVNGKLLVDKFSAFNSTVNYML